MHVEQLVRQTVALQGFRIVNVKQIGGELQVRLEPDGRFKRRCSKCGRPAPKRGRLGQNRYRHVPLWNLPCVFVYSPHRVSCPACGVHVERLDWAVGRATRAFAITVALWARMLAYSRVAKLFDCSWGLVSNCVSFVVDYGLTHRKLGQVRVIGVDEISRRKGHTYVTNVYDLEAGTLLFCYDGRGRDAMEAFFTWFGPDRTAKLESVCCDMWEPYFSVIGEYAPHASLVFDKFHVVKHLTEAVDKVRRDEIRAKGAEYRDRMRKTRYIFLTNRENLSPAKELTLTAILAMNLAITKAYVLKEAFREFWACNTSLAAFQFFDRWFWLATHSRLKPLRDFAWMIRRHLTGVLAYFLRRITNATTEGLNNKAKAIIHQAFGFRSLHTLISCLYLRMAELPMPKLKHSFV